MNDEKKQTIFKSVDVNDILNNDSAEAAIEALDNLIMDLKQNDGAKEIGIRVTMNGYDEPEAILRYHRIENDKEFQERLDKKARRLAATAKRKETIARRRALKQGLSTTSISLTGNTMLKTTPDQILFLEEAEAQRILDRQDPGHTVKTFQGGKVARVFTKEGEEVATFKVLNEAQPK